MLLLAAAVLLGGIAWELRKLQVKSKGPLAIQSRTRLWLGVFFCLLSIHTVLSAWLLYSDGVAEMLRRITGGVAVLELGILYIELRRYIRWWLDKIDR